MVEMKLTFRSGLAVIQSGELLSIPKHKLNLKPGLVEKIYAQSIMVQICAVDELSLGLRMIDRGIGCNRNVCHNRLA